MKAILLAAGTGSRLRPVTDRVPKCLLAFAGRSLLDLWLDALHRAGVDDVLVNVHHLAHLVDAHLSARPAPPAVRTSFEPVLLGSAGTLAAHRKWVQDEDVFLVANADTLTDVDIASFLDAHRRGGRLASCAVFRAPDPSACGVVEVDDEGTITGFEEKPRMPSSDLANAGIYAFSPRVLDEISGSPPLDIGYDLLPRLVGRAGAIAMEGYIRDIGTEPSYRRATLEWPERAAHVAVVR